MIDMILTFIIGIVLGYVIKSEKKPKVDLISLSQIQKFEEDIAYYKKLTKGLVEENTQMRTELRKKK